MSKVNKIFKVDAAMIPVFILLIITGIGIHIAGENGIHHSWVIWSACHIGCAVAFLTLVYIHIRQHIGWFRSLFKGNTKRRGVTVVLSVLMIAEILSGIILLAFVRGDGSFWGRFHWIAGILLAIIGAGHFLKRFRRLKNGLCNKR